MLEHKAGRHRIYSHREHFGLPAFCSTKVYSLPGKPMICWAFLFSCNPTFFLSKLPKSAFVSVPQSCALSFYAIICLGKIKRLKLSFLLFPLRHIASAFTFYFRMYGVRCTVCRGYWTAWFDIPVSLVVQSTRYEKLLSSICRISGLSL